jgi:hypothetical protein
MTKVVKRNEQTMAAQSNRKFTLNLWTSVEDAHTQNGNDVLFISRTGGGSMLGDVNISAILDSFSISYDKRVRPNYGGK